MLNFKKVLLGGHNLDVGEQSQWPELGSVGHGNFSRRSSGNCFPKPGEIKNSDPVDNSLIDNFVSSPQAIFPNTLACDFPKLADSIEKHLEKRNKDCNLRSQIGNGSEQPNQSTALNKEKIASSKCKKPKKTQSKAYMSVDVNVMLKISLNLAERRRQRKRLKHSCKRSLSVQDQLKNSVCGNKLDSDCPVRHKGKKRPHSRRKVTIIKRGFQCAADKPKTYLSASAYFTKRMNRLRQTILAGMAAEQDIDGLVINVGRMNINDTQGEQSEEQSVPLNSLDAAKSIMHTKNFRPYCNHLLKSSLKNRACELITILRTYQDRLYHRDPINSKAKRRYVCGCHEARKFLRVQAVKMLFMANNLVINNGMPPILEELLKIAEESQLPVIYAGSALDLGYWTLKKRKTSVIAILNYDGAEKVFSEVVSELNVAKKEYHQLLNNIHDHLHHQCGQNCAHHSNLDKATLQQQLEQEIRENIISQLSC